MPEGDSVLQLSERLQFMCGLQVTNSSVRVPRHALVKFDGRRVEKVWPYGKHLFMLFGPEPSEYSSDPLILHTHLKMEGQWAIHYKGDKWSRPGHTARVVIGLDASPRDIEIVGHSLGFVDCYPARMYSEKIAHLGPDILDPQWLEAGGRAEAIRRIRLRPERSIGAALLDQRNVAGIGNEYRAEACFLAGMHPALPVGQADVEKIVDISRKIMWANRHSPVRVTTGVKRAGETTYVFGRGGKRCRHCTTVLEKSVLGGVDAGGDEGELERIIWWCPRCQPET